MPRQIPIFFAVAIHMICKKHSEAFDARLAGHPCGGFHWYISNFVEWITEQGCHIELTGDEFESYAMSDKVA